MLFQFQKTNSLIFTGWMMANQVSIIFLSHIFTLGQAHKAQYNVTFLKKF